MGAAERSRHRLHESRPPPFSIGGSAGSNVFKWVKITGQRRVRPAPGSCPPARSRRPSSSGTREDGLRIDKFAFGRAGVCYTVNDLDTGGPARARARRRRRRIRRRTRAPVRQSPPARPSSSAAAWSPGTASLNFANYWNQVTPENGGKWGTVEGTRDVMNWTQADAAYALAQGQRLPVQVAHVHLGQPAADLDRVAPDRRAARGNRGVVCGGRRALSRTSTRSKW